MQQHLTAESGDRAAELGRGEPRAERGERVTGGRAAQQHREGVRARGHQGGQRQAGRQPEGLEPAGRARRGGEQAAAGYHPARGDDGGAVRAAIGGDDPG